VALVVCIHSRLQLLAPFASEAVEKNAKNGRPRPTYAELECPPVSARGADGSTRKAAWPTSTLLVLPKRLRNRLDGPTTLEVHGI
jgi:hypothetical protein